MSDENVDVSVQVSSESGKLDTSVSLCVSVLRSGLRPPTDELLTHKRD